MILQIKRYFGANSSEFNVERCEEALGAARQLGALATGNSREKSHLENQRIWLASLQRAGVPE
ncbi:hypothetical protein [Ruegeria lacuscaerulensis]|uniref:hypothetical protein n=1 Tax=Ruegeria lacuscaerulensis TaxID=55218 RepID=UPI00147EDAF1|nr:hypothetical protein [Ruegeria lacuscaerulensis]